MIRGQVDPIPARPGMILGYIDKSGMILRRLIETNQIIVGENGYSWVPFLKEGIRTQELRERLLVAFPDAEAAYHYVSQNGFFMCVLSPSPDKVPTVWERLLGPDRP